MTQTVLLCLLDEFSDWEAAYVSAGLNGNRPENPYQIRTLGLTREPVRSMGGLTVLPDYGLEEVPEDYAALLLIGGMSWRRESTQKLVPQVHRTLESGRVLGAICGATVFLAKHGFLNQARHTSNTLADLQSYAAKEYTNAALYQEERAVRDGNLITADGLSALEFARLVFEALALHPPKRLQAWYDFHRYGFAEGFQRNGPESLEALNT